VFCVALIFDKSLFDKSLFRQIVLACFLCLPQPIKRQNFVWSIATACDIANRQTELKIPNVLTCPEYRDMVGAVVNRIPIDPPEAAPWMS